MNENQKNEIHKHKRNSKKIKTPLLKAPRKRRQGISLNSGLLSNLALAGKKFKKLYF